MTQPERPAWQRPPFEPGNFVALRSGAYSKRVLAPIAAELRQELLADRSLAYLAEPWAAGAVQRHSMTRAVVQRLWAGLDELEEQLARDDLDGEQRDRLEQRHARAMAELHRFIRLADNQAARLGLDAVSRVEMTRALSPKRDLAREWAELAEEEDAASTVDAVEITDNDTEETS